MADRLSARKQALMLKTRRAQLKQAQVPPIPEPIRPVMGAEGANLGQDIVPALARRVDDIGRSVASGMSFGLADEFAARANAAVTGNVSDALTGGGVAEQNLEAERARDAEIPTRVAVGGEVLGAVATGAGLAKAGVTTLKNAPRTFRALAGRGAAEGGVFGFLQGFGRGEGVEDRINKGVAGLLSGSATGGVLGGVTRGLIGGAAKPTVEFARKEAGRAYELAEEAGAFISKDAFGKAVGRIESRLLDAGFDATLHPRALAALKRLQEGSGNNQTLKGLELLRRVVRGAGKTLDRDEGRIVGEILDEFDVFVSGLGRKDLVGGTAKAAEEIQSAVGSLKEARKLWSVTRRAEIIDDIVDRAGTRAGQFSGSGFENGLRTEFRALALNKTRLRQFPKPEQDFIKSIARGDKITNALRNLGKLAPTGIVSTALSTALGASVAGPAGAAVALGGGGLARAAATSRGVGRVNQLQQRILQPVASAPRPATSNQTNVLRALTQGAATAEAGTGPNRVLQRPGVRR